MISEAHPSIRSGMGSTNNQHIIINNFDYVSARAVAVDVCADNFLRLRGEALAAVDARLEVFRDDLFAFLAERSVPVGRLREPEKQSALWHAQKCAALSPDASVNSLLSAGLALILQKEERSRSSIVLHEAIKTIGEITVEATQILGFVFGLGEVKINYHGSPAKSVTESLKAITSDALKMVSGFVGTEYSFQAEVNHLYYAKCANALQFRRSLGSVFLHSYPGLFSKGFTVEEIRDQQPHVDLPSDSLVECPYDLTSGFQVAAVDEMQLESMAAVGGWSNVQLSKLKWMISNRALPEANIEHLLVNHCPSFQAVMQNWNKSGATLSLTSVGKAIGYMTLKSRGTLNAPIEIWI